MGVAFFEAAKRCLALRDPGEKCDAVLALAGAAVRGELAWDDDFPVEPIGAPGRPDRPELVDPARVPRRRLGSAEGRAALVHAIAHIEFNAINLACDAVYRFRGLPDAFYGDWTRVAAEEAHHFSLLAGRLAQLGYAYGDFPAHNGLWELALRTADDPLLRMALVPRVMEARGLDVTPGMIERFAGIGDRETVAILELILRDEVGHVEAGSRWFGHLCAERGLEPESTYFALLEQHLPAGVRCPLHKEARRQAGFSEAELGRLEALCRQ